MFITVYEARYIFILEFCDIQTKFIFPLMSFPKILCYSTKIPRSRCAFFSLKILIKYKNRHENFKSHISE